MDEGSAPSRILPPVDDLSRAFWSDGATDRLSIQRCSSCHHWHHPPVSHCPACGDDLVPEPVSGRGTLFSFTENFQPYNPAVPVPYVIAIVQLDEQDDLRLPTNIVHADPETLYCGMPVQVLFEKQDDVFVPVFEPAPTKDAERP
jgi:hypothetical protein